MFIKKRDKGGFINREYEKANLVFGWLTLILICAAFLFVIVMIFKGE